MNKKHFEDYLKEVHAETYIGTDDDMGDDFDLWLSERTVDDMLEYGEKAIALAIQKWEDH